MKYEITQWDQGQPRELRAPGRAVLGFYSGVTMREARLIAAAPKLLEMCKKWVQWADGWCPTSQCCALSAMEIADETAKAIAEAETEGTS